MRGGNVHTRWHLRHCVEEPFSDCRGAGAALNSSERLRAYGWASLPDPFTLAWDRLALGEPGACAAREADAEAKELEGEDGTGCGGGAMTRGGDGSTREGPGDRQGDVAG